MIRVEHLTLRVPHFMAPHAEQFARRVGEALAAMDHGGATRSGRIDGCPVGPLTIDPSVSPARAAELVAAQVARALTRSHDPDR